MSVEAAVEYLREREADAIDRIRHVWSVRHSRIISTRHGNRTNICYHTEAIRRIRALLYSLRDVERRARIEGIREGMSMAQERASAFCMSSCGADIDWDRAESTMRKRIAELESE